MPLRAAHLEDMRLRGLVPETTIYARRLTLARLEAWLAARQLESGRQARLLAPGESRRGKIAGLESPPGPQVPVAAGRMQSPAALEDATAADLLAWRASLTLTPRSVATNCVHVREFYRWLQATGYRPDNPAAGIPVPRSGRSLPRPIPEDDLFRAFETASRRIRPWLALAAGGGLRAKEIALLRRENVSETARVPSIRIAADATKGRDERVIPMSPFVAEELALYGLPASGWVFRRYDGQAGPNKPWLISRLANRHLHASGTPHTLHSLRHRFLSLAYQESLDLRLVQEIAGHRSPESTAGYAAINNVRAAEVVNALPVPSRLRIVREEGAV